MTCTAGTGSVSSAFTSETSPIAKTSTTVRVQMSCPGARRSSWTICTAKQAAPSRVIQSPHLSENARESPSETNPTPARHSSAATKLFARGRRLVSPQERKGTMTQ